MKGKGSRKRKISLPIIITILIHVLFITPTELANGGQIIASFNPCPNEPPDRPINIYPEDGAVDIDIPVTLEVLVYDNTSINKGINVYFYNASDNVLIDNVTVENGSIASVVWNGLQNGRSYSWYTVANDSDLENTSGTWSFATKPSQSPVIHNNEYPANGSTNVELEPTCSIEISDGDGDLMNIYWYQYTTEGWVLRKTNSSVENGTYYWAFAQANSYSTTYYWKVAVNDSTDNTTAIFHFTTKSQPSPQPGGGGGYTPPPNQHPIANITGPPTGYVNQTLVFYAYYSYDQDGYITGYRWDFNNDGLFDTDWEDYVVGYYNYSGTGNYTVKLQVKDDDGAISTDSYIIIIKQLEPPLQLPVAQANGPYMSFTNENITFSSTGSYDPDGTIVNYTWDFGDNHTSYMENPIHSYAQPGSYIVILKVRDNDNLSNSAVAAVSIREREKEQPLPMLLILFMVITATMMPVLILKSKRRRRQIYYYMRIKLNNVHNTELKVDELLSGLDNKNNKEIKKEKLRNHRNPREKLEQSLRKRR